MKQISKKEYESALGWWKRTIDLGDEILKAYQDYLRLSVFLYILAFIWGILVGIVIKM